jgi:DNA-3-methyladenine glycosylase II
MYLRDIPHIRQSLDHLRGSDSILSPLDITDDQLPWPVHETGFKGMVRIVQGQQISAKVASTLWARLDEHCQTTNMLIDVPTILGLDSEDLRPFGFSKQKFNYIHGMAEAINNGAIDIAHLERLDNQDVIKEIIKVKGFGLWSAQLYLMFCMTRPNVLPAKDLGLDRAVQALFKLQARPSYEELCEYTKQWDGHLTAATMLLWAAYSNNKL